MLNPNPEHTLFIKGPLIKETVMKQWVDIKSRLRHESFSYVDLHEVTQCDSAGVAFLVAIFRETKRKAIPIVFRQISEQMLAIARVNGVMAFLPTSES